MADILHLIFTWKEEAFRVALLLIAVAAWRWGAAPERVCIAIVIGILWFGDVANHWLAGRGPTFLHVETGHLILDLAAGVALLAVALRANRVYPLWLTAFQGLVLLTHFAEGLTATAPLAYSILSIAPSYFITVLLAGGIWMHHRRETVFGPYPSWRG